MPAEPPRNGEYLVAAYVVATVILLGYWMRLWRTARRIFSAGSSSPAVRSAQGRLREGPDD
jgi:hypothetical protein